MNKTIALCLSMFMLLGLVGAVAQNSAVTASDEPTDIQAINTAALASADSVPSMVDPGRVINTPLRIGESAWGKFQATCQKAREWSRVNVVDTTSGHHNYVGKYKFDSQAVNENGEHVCQILRYAEKSHMGKCDRSADDFSSSRKKVYDTDGNIVGYVWRHQCVKTQPDWKIVDLNQPEQSYSDFKASLDTTIAPAPIFANESGV